MDIHKLKWNYYFGKKKKTPVYDRWLDPYLDRLEPHKDRPVLDLGCGAGKGKEIERKRFFDEEAVDGLLASDLRIIDKSEATMHRYAKEKKVWEFAAIKSD